MDFIERLQAKRQRLAQQRAEQADKQTQGYMVKNLEQIKDKPQPTEFSVKNFPKPAITKKDVEGLSNDLQKLITSISAKNSKDTIQALENVIKTLKLIDGNKELTGVRSAVEALSKKLENLPKAVERVAPSIKFPKDRTDEVVKAVKGLKLDPKIDVKSPDVKVPAIDTSKIESIINMLAENVDMVMVKLGDMQPEVNIDMASVVSGLEKVQKQIKSIVFPVPEFPTTMNITDFLLPTSGFDYIGITNSATDEDTLVYKTGGSGGTAKRTLVVGYASGAEKISDTLSTLEYS